MHSTASITREANGTMLAQLDAGQEVVTACFRVSCLGAHDERVAARLQDSLETMLIVPAAGVSIQGPEGWCEVPSRSVVVLPPVTIRVRLAPGSPAYCLSPGPLSRDAPLRFTRRKAPDTPQIYRIDDVRSLPHNPRIKMFQCASMSVNWTEYDGPRDRSRLSPHLHESFAQGALTLSGRFVHHLRVPWGSDAGLWLPDRHMAVGPGAFTEIPAGVIHTTEGIGDGLHHLIEMFCPPRADFIAKGYVANATDYVPVTDSGDDA